jgi:hypothetical protein
MVPLMLGQAQRRGLVAMRGQHRQAGAGRDRHAEIVAAASAGKK